MSGNDLAAALISARARADAVTNAPAATVAEEEAVAILRQLARTLGHAPEAVVESFLKGGPLADLVRAVIGAEAPRRRRRGRPPKRAETWHAFVRVVLLRRAGLTLEEAIGRIAEETGTPEATIRSQYDRTREAGARPDDVPDSPVVAAFADPRPKA